MSAAGSLVTDTASGNPMPGPNSPSSAAYDLGLGDQLARNLDLEDEKRKQALKDKMAEQGAQAIGGGILSPATMALLGGSKY